MAKNYLEKYISLGPQDSIEDSSPEELLWILFGTFEIWKHEYFVGAINQLVVVLCLGTRVSGYTVARYLGGIFSKNDKNVGKQLVWLSIVKNS